MKLFGQIAVHVRGEDILRKPGILDKLKKAFGGTPDLRTGKMRASLEAAVLVDSVRDALRKLDIDNAVSLIVDELTLFQDKEGRPGDLGDLFLAFHEHSPVIGGSGFDLIRLTVEHVEAGLHMVIEVQAKSEHAATDPAVRVIVSGRLHDLAPRRGEDAETYRKRVEPITKDPSGLEVSRMQFESFVERVRDAIAAAMPDARVQVVTAEARVQRPPRNGRQPEQREQDPRGRQYDPYDAWYPSPFGTMLSVMMWSSLFSMMHTPHYTVINEYNEPSGHTDDPGAEHGDTGGDHGGDHGDHGDGGAHGDDGGDGGGDGWGDWGGGDGGGFDFGGFD